MTVGNQISIVVLAVACLVIGAIIGHATARIRNDIKMQWDKADAECLERFGSLVFPLHWSNDRIACIEIKGYVGETGTWPSR